jgi:putative addiction module component (TIGR02574 family)
MVDRNAEVLAQQLLAWPVADRARLAELLIASLETSERDSEGTWEAEINRRASELDHGRVTGVAVAQVLAEIDRRLGP